MARERMHTIFVTGDKECKWVKQTKLEEVLKKIVKSIWPDTLGWIITGTTRKPLEDMVVNAAKNMKLNTMLVPANFQLLGGASAEQFRNTTVIETFKPDLVVIFSNTEMDSVLEHTCKIARRRSELKIVDRNFLLNSKRKK